MDMPANSGVGLIEEAIFQKNKADNYQLYLAYLPNMTADNFMTFEEFISEAITERSKPSGELSKPKHKSKEEIMNNVENIIDNYSV